MSEISPIGGSNPYFEPTNSSSGQQLINQMLDFEKELREEMGPPPQEEKLEVLLVQMEGFLMENKAALYQAMEAKGYPLDGPFSISSEFDSALSCIKNYFEHPNFGSLTLLNESITQMHFYLTHQNA